MKLSPFLSAAFAGIYIALVVSVINGIMSVTHEGDGDGVLIPMAMLSLFVLSAGVMGYLFVYEPLHLYFEGQKEEAVGHFLKSLGFFACFAFIFVALVFFVFA